LDRTFEGGQSDKELASRKAISDAGNTTQLTIADGIRNSEGNRLAWQVMETALAREDTLTADQKVTSRRYTEDFLTTLSELYNDPDLSPEGLENAVTFEKSAYTLLMGGIGLDTILNDEDDDGDGMPDALTIDTTPDGSITTPASDALNQNIGNVVNAVGGNYIAGLVSTMNNTTFTPQMAVDNAKTLLADFTAGSKTGPQLMAALGQYGTPDAQAEVWARATGTPKADALRVINGVPAVKAAAQTFTNSGGADKTALIAALKQHGRNPEEMATLYSLATGADRTTALAEINAFAAANPGLLGTVG